MKNNLPDFNFKWYYKKNSWLQDKNNMRLVRVLVAYLIFGTILYYFPSDFTVVLYLLVLFGGLFYQLKR